MKQNLLISIAIFLKFQPVYLGNILNKFTIEPDRIKMISDKSFM